MAAQIAAIIAPLCIIAGLGFFWARRGLPFDKATITAVTTHVGAPCLVFSSIVRLDLGLDAFLQMIGAGVVALTCFGVIGAAMLRAGRLPIGPYLPALMFPNAGNLGLPIVYFAFGDVGLALGAVFSTVIAVGHFTVGVALASGQASIRPLLSTPLLYALALALLFRGLEAPPPDWLLNVTGLLGGIAIPLMLFSLGVSLAGLRLGGIGRSAVLAGARVLVGFAVGVGVALGFDLPPVAAGTLIIQCSMPVAVFNYLFAVRYQGPSEEIAGMILVSTGLVFVSLPVLLRVVL